MTVIAGDDDDLTFVDAIVKGDFGEIRKWFVNLKFRQSDTVKMRFDLVIMLFSLFNCFFVPVKVAFEPKQLDTPEYNNANYIIDFFFFLDILISFRTVTMNEKGVEIVKSWDIAKNYLKSTFIIDFLATFPFDLILEIFKAEAVKGKISVSATDKYVEIFGILKLGRILRLSKIIAFLKTTSDVKASLKILKMVLFLVVYLHCYTCLWWFCVRKTNTWMPPMDQAFAIDYSIYTSNFFKKYLYSLLYAVQVCLGSDVFPSDSVETWFTSIGLFCGAIINANIFGELALIFSELDKHEKEFQLKIVHMNTAMINLELPF